MRVPGPWFKNKARSNFTAKDLKRETVAEGPSVKEHGLLGSPSHLKPIMPSPFTQVALAPLTV